MIATVVNRDSDSDFAFQCKFKPKRATGYLVAKTFVGRARPPSSDSYSRCTPCEPLDEKYKVVVILCTAHATLRLKDIDLLSTMNLGFCRCVSPSILHLFDTMHGYVCHHNLDF